MLSCPGLFPLLPLSKELSWIVFILSKIHSDIAHPLHQCATTVPFCWTTESENVFQRLTQAPILTYTDASAMFILDTDASSTGIGAVLSQVSSPEQERVVAYYSCTST